VKIGSIFGLEAREPRAAQKSSRTFILDGIGPVLFEKTRRARRISLTVRASRGVRVAVPWRVSFQEAPESRMPDARHRQSRLREYSLALF
jgi:hypothetical protein